MSRNQLVIFLLALIGLGVVFTLAQQKNASQAAEPWVVPEAEAAKANPASFSAADRSRAEANYQKYCVTCHGPKGLGDGALAKYLKPAPVSFADKAVQEQSDGSLFYKISEGRGRMVSYKGSISEQDRWQLVHLIRTLGGQEPAAAKVPEQSAKAPAESPQTQPADGAAGENAEQAQAPGK